MGIELGQFIPGNSIVHGLDPRVKLLSLFLYGVAILLAPTGIAAVLVGCAIIPLIGLAGIQASFIWHQLRPLLIFMVIIFAVQVLLTPGETVFTIGFVQVTGEGLNLGLMALARVFFLVMAASLLTATTDPLSLSDGLEKLLMPGRRIGLPAQELALMLTLALRFVPTMLEEAERIMRAQMARGASFKGRKIINLMPLIIPLFISAFRRAEGLAEAMEARAYQGGKTRTRMRELQLKRKDYIFFLLTVILTAGSLSYRLMVK